MVQVGVDPVAFTIGSFSLRWYGVIVVIAIAFLTMWSARFAKKVGFSSDFVFGAALWS